MQRRTVGVFLALLLGLVSGAVVPGGAAEPTFKTFVVDVGTGLGVYLEFPGAPGKRPIRVVYDTGKGAGRGLDNDLVSFLVDPKVGLKPAEGDFEGDVIDYFILSHPHEDHYNGAGPLFESFDVRNVIESKQIHSPKYLQRFKAPAINEIQAARASGKDAHYYVVGLPYPNGFDQPRDGQPYDEYAICQAHLPEFMKETVDCAAARGKVRFPFGPEQVAQQVDWPVLHFMGERADMLEKYVDEAYREGPIPVELLPLGTHFPMGRSGGFTILHGDTVAGFDHAETSRKVYQEAFPYFGMNDLNDGSVAIRAVYKEASVMIPGDAEGRPDKPTKRVRLVDVFGSGKHQDAYSKADLEAYLRRGEPEAEQLPILPQFERYVLGAEDILRLGYYAYVTMDRITPRDFQIELEDEPYEIGAHQFAGPEDLDEDMVFMQKRSEQQRSSLHPEWRQRLFSLYQDLVLNSQKFNALKTRFSGWTKGRLPRILEHEDEGRFMLDWENPVWTVTNLVQLTERIYYVDPGLANVLAGCIMRSDLFLEYVAPPDKKDWSMRGERHILDVGAQIEKDSGVDVIDSDVLVFGHHGSFTSSSLGFVLQVDPNVGIISADDKSYAGSTLPDFSALFWNMNSHHPEARRILHSLFFHSDLLAQKRGEPVDGYTYRNRYSQGAARVFRARRRWPIPIWRTDFNDDLVNVNTLMDNIAIETTGEAPIWDWARHRGKGEDDADAGKDAIPDDVADATAYQYWAQELVSAHPPGSKVIRPHDPSGVIRTFDVQDRLPMRVRQADGSMLEVRTWSRGRPLADLLREVPASAAEDEVEDEVEDWTLGEDR